MNASAGGAPRPEEPVEAYNAWAVGSPAQEPPEPPEPSGPSRRSVLTAAGLGVGGIALLGFGWSRVRGGSAVTSSGPLPPLPTPVSGAAPTAGVDVGVPGVSAFRTPTEEFFLIDTAFGAPRVDAAAWRLRIHGMVRQEITLDYAGLLAREQVERDVTLSCVSNEVGGDLVGNARWLGTRIAPILAEAGPLPDADMVLSTSQDGWTASTPLEALTDDRDALLAVAMNGEVLSPSHGFPVRMVVPGLYGFVSATKWLVDLEVTRFDRATAYWTSRGWSDHGPVKLSSRIDVPRAGASIKAGEVAVGGVAWEPHTGIDAVQVRVDDGDWRPARLGASASADAWRQWAFAWPATPGRHRLAVRAVDGAGRVQTGERTDVVPDGATGWHTIEVDVQ